MNTYLAAFLTALAVSAGGTVLGAFIAIRLHTTRRTLSCVLLGLAAGLILALVLLDMLPESWEAGGPAPFILGVAAGVLLMAFIMHRSHGGHAHEVDDSEAREIVRNRSLVKTGLLLATGMAIHNLPQGIAIGSAVSSSVIGGLVLLLFLHNIPEGTAMAIPLRVAGARPERIIFVAVLTAVPTIIGALVGAAFSNVSPAFESFSFAFAGGAMLLLAVRELIPQSLSLANVSATTAAVVGGTVLGAVLILLIE